MSSQSYADAISGPGPHGVPELSGVLPDGPERGVPSSARETTEVVMPAAHELIIVSCYTRFDNLAHGPRGTEARRSLYTFCLDKNDGELVLFSVTTDDSVMNPAFSRFDSQRNLLYTCTESVAEPGEIVTYSVDPRTGKLVKLGCQCAGGTSTCYLTLDKESKNMLVVNYWNATIGVFGIDSDSGVVGEAKSVYDPNSGKGMKVSYTKHVNHSENDTHSQKERQSDPHSHAVILDPYFGKIAYVPDLGMDLIRQFRFNPQSGTLEAAGTCRSGPESKSLGPRYIEFHPTLPFAYVVNELSSEVSVFQFDHQAAERLLSSSDPSKEESTLRLVQTVRTIPDAWPGDMNTCGRITVHKSGHFVLVSNRGHNSITIFRVHHELGSQGLLSLAHLQHTRGATPRHFQFDSSGQWLISANQDSDTISVFRFNIATGAMEWTGNEYHVPSPNFVCSARPQMRLSARAQASREGAMPLSRL
eukprot:CAMPEP_0181432050 /NCGR_PEP_ID=MMETSP1110-20121109/18567_1 /TAXON_ID=174948 /ORGANISM="Symbiodinium sp., Strain CCMP421" /LENGTH=473 /DNA_ID=CAMNT_0023555441 /DNA_START=108 /DNA_END=1529 /DNA_ORIENTATION=-